MSENICKCGINECPYHKLMCTPDCYYQQLQKEKQKNKKTEKTLKEIEEMIKKDCLVNCEYCDSYDFKECCEKGCLNTEILEKIKEVENERQI